MKPTDEEIVKILKHARKLYKTKSYFGMCGALLESLFYHGYIASNVEGIKEFIPMFKPIFFKELNIRKRTLEGFTHGYWWDIDERAIRLSAFKKMIKHYEAREREETRNS